MKYAFAQAHREEFELKRMCRVLQVSAAGITTGPDVKRVQAQPTRPCAAPGNSQDSPGNPKRPTERPRPSGH